MNELLKIEPFTRVNDAFVFNDDIDASPIDESVRNLLITTPPNCIQDRFQPDFYQNIACDIVTETVLDYPYPYISEKTLRPISCKRMFIVLGPTGILSHLHSKGFYTFGDFINEEYDSITDSSERFFAVTNEIDRLCDRPLEEIVQYLHDNSWKLEHNFEQLMLLQNKEIEKLLEAIQ